MKYTATLRNLLVGLVLISTLSGCAQLGFRNWDRWSAYDKSVYGVAWTARIADVLQTRYIYDHPDEFEEGDFIVSSICDNKDCATAVLIGAEWVVGVFADNLLPSWRSALLTFEAGKNCKVAFDNNQISVKFAW